MIEVIDVPAQLERDILLMVESAAKVFCTRAGVTWNGFMRTIVRTWARERIEVFTEKTTDDALWLVRVYVVSVLLPEEQRNQEMLREIKWNTLRWGRLTVTVPAAFGRWLQGV